MNAEFSLANQAAKTRILSRLRAHGWSADSGPIRLAYPFSVLVEGVSEPQLQDVVDLLVQVDPCAGLIVTSDDRPAVTA